MKPDSSRSVEEATTTAPSADIWTKNREFEVLAELSAGLRVCGP